MNLEIKYINLGTNIPMVRQMLLFMKPFIVFYFFRFGKGSSETTYHLELSPLCRPATLPLTTSAMFRCTARVRSLYPKAWTVELSLKLPLSLWRPKYSSSKSWQNRSDKTNSMPSEIRNFTTSITELTVIFSPLYVCWDRNILLLSSSEKLSGLAWVASYHASR